MSDICKITGSECIRCNSGDCWMRKKKQEIKFSEQRVVDKTIDQLDHMILSVNKIKDKNKHGYVQQYFSCDNVILMLNKLNEFIKEQ